MLPPSLHQRLIPGLILSLVAFWCLSEARVSYAQPSPQARASVSPQANANPQASAPASPQSGAQNSASPEASGNAKSDAKTAEGKGVASPLYWIVAGLIVLLALLFTLLIWWSSKLEQASYLGTLFHDAVEKMELERILQPYTEKFANYGYHAHVRRDEKVREAIKKRRAAEEEEAKKRRAAKEEAERLKLAAAGATDVTGVQAAPSGTGTGSGDGGIRGTGSGSGSGWEPEEEREANKRYQIDRDEAKKLAAKRAKLVASADLNVLRGRGAEFVLEFTAVVFLVFAVTILGLLDVLQSEPIATLLAAIAGYVLGRASSGKQSGGQGDGARAGTSTAEIIQLINAVKGAPTTDKRASGNDEESDPEHSAASRVTPPGGKPKEQKGEDAPVSNAS